jgi:hypothetical protein
LQHRTPDRRGRLQPDGYLLSVNIWVNAPVPGYQGIRSRDDPPGFNRFRIKLQGV